MNFGNLHLLANGKTGAKRISNSVEKADKPIADIDEKVEDPDRRTKPGKGIADATEKIEDLDTGTN